MRSDAWLDNPWCTLTPAASGEFKDNLRQIEPASAGFFLSKARRRMGEIAVKFCL